MIEPSDAERAGWPDTTAEYVAELEKQLAEAVEILQTLVSYGRWTIGDESPGHHPTLPSAVAMGSAFLAQHKAPVERLTPAPPWPVSPDTNCKREGWRSFFAGVERDACPFPLGRADLQRGFREGWDAAAQHQSPQSSGDANVDQG